MNYIYPANNEKPMAFCISCRKRLLNTLDTCPPHLQGRIIQSLYCQWPTCVRYGLATILYLTVPDLTTFSKERKKP